MKTDREQIEQMIKIFTDNREVCQHMRCVECKYHGDKECMYSSCAYSLYQAGYGDVSEYKAEIERLKSDNEALTMWNEAYTEENEKLKEENKKLEEDIDMIIKEQKDDCKFDIKQAKIDVLKELRERIETAIDTYYNSDGGGYYLAEDVLDDIDLLIEEVEKQ